MKQIRALAVVSRLIGEETWPGALSKVACQSGLLSVERVPKFFLSNSSNDGRTGLLGTYLGKSSFDGWEASSRSFAISETEAYLGAHDLASHAARGRTARTEVMFGNPGVFYIYLVYGLHWMINVVTGAAGHPAAVLVRSAGMLIGPGRLARELAVTGVLNGKVAQPATGLWFEEPALAPHRYDIVATPRVGVDYAGPVWANRKLRFALKGT